ncbi:MAG: peptide chain release factor N(5)-glutamine methyltransferase [Flammeovirgaceae bacterium]|nr:peptide chain release factor N(5)-glutamine methyltransferase [Flammeovirgaceae bacterium]
MTNSKDLFNELVGRITLDEKKAEIQSVIYLLLENKLGLTRTEILSDKLIDNADQSALNLCIERINNHEPIQYILGEAFFYGRLFKVNPAVLIPRPETELLVREIISYEQKMKGDLMRILDIGTGSGCIAISLALEIKNATVLATDVSPTALNCAKENSILLGASVRFIDHDILKEALTESFDLIVSNPPYISFEEKPSMKPNVLKFEPHLALFASEADPLLFYKKIIEKSKKSLSAHGSLWFEINEHFGQEAMGLLKAHGFVDIQIIKDLDGKERIVSGHLPREIVQKT